MRKEVRETRKEVRETKIEMQGVRDERMQQLRSTRPAPPITPISHRACPLITPISILFILNIFVKGLTVIAQIYILYSIFERPPMVSI